MIHIKTKVIDEAGYSAAILGLSLNKKKKPDDMKVVAERLSQYDGGHNKFLESIKVWIEVTAPRYWWSEADTYRLTTKQSNSTMHTLLQELLSFPKLNKLKEELRYNFPTLDNKTINQIACNATYMFIKRQDLYTSELLFEYTNKLKNYVVTINEKEQSLFLLDILFDIYGNDSFSNIQSDNEKLLSLFENIPQCLTHIISYMTETALNESIKDAEKLVLIKQVLPEGFLQTRIWLVDYKTLRNIFKQRKNHRLPHWNMFIDDIIKQLKHPEYFNDILTK